jgi:hypothetical protein
MASPLAVIVGGSFAPPRDKILPLLSFGILLGLSRPMLGFRGRLFRSAIRVRSTGIGISSIILMG